MSKNVEPFFLTFNKLQLHRLASIVRFNHIKEVFCEEPYWKLVFLQLVKQHPSTQLSVSYESFIGKIKTVLQLLSLTSVSCPLYQLCFCDVMGSLFAGALLRDSLFFSSPLGERAVMARRERDGQKKKEGVSAAGHWAKMIDFMWIQINTADTWV